MGEKEHEPFQVTFNGLLKVAFQGSRVTSDTGLIPVRELDERLGLETSIKEVRLQLSVLAYNFGNLWRRLVLPKRIDSWSLTSLQQRLVKTGGRLVKHARYYWLLLAESHLTQQLFAPMLRRIWALPGPTG